VCVAALALVLAATVGAPVALGAETRLDGSPIDVYADGQARMQFRYDGVAEGVFFNPALNAPSAGLEVMVNGGAFPLGRATHLSGPDEITVAPGTRALKSSYQFGDFIRVDETIAYTDGAQTADVTYLLTNITGGRLADVRAGLLADLFVAQHDEGVGVLSGAAPNRFIGGRSAAGTVSGLTEITPWSAYQEGQFNGPDDVFDSFELDGLRNTINASNVDNTVGVQWNFVNLAPGAPQTIATRWTLGPPTAEQIAAQTPGPGGGTTLPPPVAGKSVNLKLLSGTVLYKLPGSKTFLKLTAETQVPVGTTLDTLKGRVNITAASDLKGGTNKSWFYDGIFKISQAVAAKPVTELALAGPKPSCKKARSTAADAAARKKPKTRKLWGDGSGQFRTRGQFSSATVRGTKWVVIDRCDGTLTRVVRGVVAVRDNVKRKTIIVRAGKQYLARKKK
jgi:hypothetical protein